MGWELEVADSSLVQTLAYVFPSVLGGVVVLAGALLVWLLFQAVLTGDFARVIGLVAIELLGLLTRRYLPALLTNIPCNGCSGPGRPLLTTNSPPMRS